MKDHLQDALSTIESIIEPITTLMMQSTAEKLTVVKSTIVQSVSVKPTTVESNIENFISQAKKIIGSVFDSISPQTKDENEYSEFFAYLIKLIPKLPQEYRREFGGIVNQYKNKYKAIESTSENNQGLVERENITIPVSSKLGRLHLFNLFKNKVRDWFFRNMNAIHVRTPQIEEFERNFTMLNIPKHHPSISDHDTIFINSDLILRTQTSAMQTRIMEEVHGTDFDGSGSLINAFTIGTVYRSDDLDSTHLSAFHQVEYILVGKDINYNHLISIVNNFITSIIGKKEIRIRHSYFPFTEPSFEIDIYHQGRWIELLGCGLINRKILSNSQLGSYTGLALGCGFERLFTMAMDISDVRDIFQYSLGSIATAGIPWISQ